jgi:hypothetical protein
MAGNQVLNIDKLAVRFRTSLAKGTLSISCNRQKSFGNQVDFTRREIRKSFCARKASA